MITQQELFDLATSISDEHKCWSCLNYNGPKDLSVAFGFSDTEHCHLVCLESHKRYEVIDYLTGKENRVFLPLDADIESLREAIVNYLYARR